MRVLIVEDELEIAAVIEDVALKLGFDVIGLAKNAAEAIQMAGDADIAVVDVRLADGLSGPQIAQELVSRYGIGVVFLTGNPELIPTDLRISVVTKSPDPSAIAKALSDAAASRQSRSNPRFK
ncbi:response regulator (plasmid) [Sinorhizobium sp. B11]